MIAYSTLSILPSLDELGSMWPFVATALILAALWRISSAMEDQRYQLHWMKRRADIKHKAHMEMSR